MSRLGFVPTEKILSYIYETPPPASYQTLPHFRDQPSALEVRAGSSFRLEGGTMYYVQSIIQHPQYNNNTGDYDITILKLTTPLALGPGIAPITLASADRPIVAGEWGNLTGWGRFVEGGQTARQLQVVEVPVLDHDECYRTYYWIRKVTDRMLCAGIENKGGKASCNVSSLIRGSNDGCSVGCFQGDSGGPFVIDGVLVGLVSWAWGCARPNYHDVYASIPALRGFIYDTVGI